MSMTISNLFDFNKSRNYLQFADLANSNIVTYIGWVSLCTSAYLGLPCVIYSLVLERRRRKGGKYFPASLVFGLCFGVWIDYLFINLLGECSFLNVFEGCVQVLGVLLVVVILVPLLLEAIPMRQFPSEQIVDNQLPDALLPPHQPHLDHQAQSQKSSKKKVRINFITIFIAILLLPVFSYLTLWCVYPVIWEYNTRRETLHVLASANSEEDFKQSLRYGGVFLTFPDGSWMAIRYRDIHVGWGGSLSIVRDSGGLWYESHHHFCGNFVGFISDYNFQRDLRELGEITSIDITRSYDGLKLVGESKTLAEARGQLLKNGFTTLKK